MDFKSIAINVHARRRAKLHAFDSLMVLLSPLDLSEAAPEHVWDGLKRWACRTRKLIETDWRSKHAYSHKLNVCEALNMQNVPNMLEHASMSSTNNEFNELFRKTDGVPCFVMPAKLSRWRSHYGL